jgi:ABC-type transport system involved in multi-copper enzyme maturation permease subunit
MIGTIAAFEIRKRRSLLSTYVYFGLFLAIAFLTTIAAGGAFQGTAMIVGGSGGKTMVNSPFVIFEMTSLLSYFGLLVTSAIMGNAVYQDFHDRTYMFFFTAPIRKFDYLLGRFLGAALVLTGIFASIALGSWLGSLMPFVDRADFGPNRLSAYLQPYWLIVLPNLIITGALFFGLAALVRKILPVYVTSVVLLIGYLIASALTQKLEWKLTAALVDPFGLNAVQYVTEYWTVSDRNTLLVPLSGALLWNRILWLGAATTMLAGTLWRFRFTEGGEQRRDRSRAEVELPASAAVDVPIATRRDYRSALLLPELTWLAFKETVKNVYFAVIVLAGVLFMIMAAQTTDSMFGTETYPVTASIMEISGGSFALFLLIIITFYAGELVWRERDAGVDQLMDVLPISNWLPLVAKLLALILVQVVLLAVVMFCGMGIQASQGYFKFEPEVYLKDLFGFKLVTYALLCVLAITVQVVVNHKYFGHFAMVLFYLVTAFMGAFGFGHKLYHYAGTPGYTYSDMNGFGHFVHGVAWFDAYWAVCALLLAMLASLFWVRGMDRTVWGRMKLARARLSRGMLGAMALLAALFVGLGCFIFYNTNVLNTYKSRYQREHESAQYEVKYKHLEKTPQPRITDLKLAVDIDPAGRRLRGRGTLTLANRTNEPIAVVYLAVRPTLIVHRLAIGDLDRPAPESGKVDFYTFTLAAPLEPSASTALAFDLELANPGFKNGGGDTEVVYNGTFFNSGILPQVGYDPGQELEEDSVRRKHDLPPKARMADIDDLAARRNNYLSNQADWMSLDATVSTSPDQIAIVPGYLDREWLENGRRYFHYQTDAKILDLFSVLSGRYEVRRDRWRGPVAFGRSDAAAAVGKALPGDAAEPNTVAPSAGEPASRRDNRADLIGHDQDVAIEIYYHRGHEYNVDNMIQSIKDSLDYFTRYFSPYQHRQVRIIEFPRYRTFAQSFPNTIPYSEGIGFVARVNPADPDDIDYPYYVTAHEVAHQWWGYQVIGGNVQGATMLSETMAQYSALMVMKRKFGPDQMRRFLRYELDRYLQGRAMERKKELPLARNENQGYIHYNKGSLVMYALQDYLGEEKLNGAIAQYLRSVAYQDPPYTNSLEFIEHIRQITPPELLYLIEDLFETITLYDNRALKATYVELAPDRYEVKLSVAVKKLRADELGVESELPLADLIDVGVLDSKGKPLVLEKKRFDASPAEFTFEVTGRPAKAGIDPLNLLIDRKPDDNVIRVEKGD